MQCASSTIMVQILFEKFSSVRILQDVSCSRHISGEVKIPWNISSRSSWELYIRYNNIDTICLHIWCNVKFHMSLFTAAVLICIFLNHSACRNDKCYTKLKPRYPVPDLLAES